MTARALLQKPPVILGLLFAVTSLFLLFTVDVAVTDAAGVRLFLPKNLGGAWEGYDVLFCQNPGCGRSWLERDVPVDDEGNRHCPRNWQNEPCGGELLNMSLGEKLVLPKDTVMMKKQYFASAHPGESVFTSVVLSGKDRTSIHRPEVCMDAQGHVIQDSLVLEVPMAGRKNLKVKVLLLNKKYSEDFTHYSYYAYFFIGKDRTTHLHFERLMWMSMDRIFRNVAHRWAYIAVSGERSPDKDDLSYQDEIRDVISKLYPEISLLDDQS